MRELNQNRIFIKRQAKIFDNKIVYKSNYFGKECEATIHFEELLRHKDSDTFNTLNIKTVAVILIYTIPIFFAYGNSVDDDWNAWIFLGCLHIILGIFYWFNRQDLWKVKVSNNTYLFFFKKIPSQKEVDSFIEYLFTSRDKYLKETYLNNSNRLLSYESQLNNLDWLYKVEAIDKPEYEKKKYELDSMFNADFNKIGLN